jgi:hypothetical protein
VDLFLPALPCHLIGFMRIIFVFSAVIVRFCLSKTGPYMFLIGCMNFSANRRIFVHHLLLLLDQSPDLRHVMCPVAVLCSEFHLRYVL